MANQNIKLEKNIVSNKASNDLYNKNFNNIAKSDVEVDQSRILDIQDIVFYNTPKTGTYSHTSIVQRIYDYINTPLNRALDTQIETLSDNLILLNDELDNRQSPFEAQHPVYANGSFIIAGENGVKYDGLDTVYVMQEGLKRPIDNPDIYKSIRKCFDLPYTGSLTYSGLYFVNLEEINTINEGARITTTDDFNISGVSLDVEDTEIEAYYSSYVLELQCVGKEHEDAADKLVVEPDAEFYLAGGCTVEYFFSGEEENRKSVSQGPIGEGTVSFTKGQKRIIRIGRNNDLQPTIDGVPNNAEYNITDVQYNGNTVQDYIREWGEGTKYDGITRVTGRVKYKELGKDREIYDNPGGQKILNGLPSNFTISSQGLGNEVSSWGTKIIYPGGSGMHGDQQHEDHFQNVVFNDPASDYYHPMIYGQPIFRYNSDFLVLLGHNFVNNQVIFISLEKKPDRKNRYASGYPQSPIWDLGNDTGPLGFHIVGFNENKLKNKEENDKHIVPLRTDGNQRLSWKEKDWAIGRLRYKGFRNVGTFGFDTTNQAEIGVKSPTGKNALQEGFIYPSYLFDNHPNQWTPWD